MTLDDNLGFTKNPFSLKSSEQEIEFISNIFFEPNYYQTLTNDLSNGVSTFIIGQRGHGKSSIINKLLFDLGEQQIFTVKLDRFDSIPIKKNETALIKLILKHSVTKLVIFLHSNKKEIKKLEKPEKEKLALCHRLFYITLSKSEYTNTYTNFHKVKTNNRIRRIFNICLVPINTMVSAASGMISNTVRQSIVADNFDSKVVYTEFFKEINEIEYDKIDVDSEAYSKEQLKEILDEILLIIKKIGFKTTVILFDKIDEFQDLNQDINQIANFTKEILSDTELLMNDKLAIGFSLWSELKTELAGKVRFDKFGYKDISWLSKNLEPLINLRIKYFSKTKDLTLDKLMPFEEDRKELIKLANKSPRDLIIALDAIYQEQSNTNQNVNCFENQCITTGLINFCKKYDYDSIYPSKVGKNKEITAMINRILTMRQIRFTTQLLTTTFNQRPDQSLGQIKIMKDYKLIREEEILGPNNYGVIDPKVEYLIKRGELKID